MIQLGFLRPRNAVLQVFSFKRYDRVVVLGRGPSLSRWDVGPDPIVSLNHTPPNRGHWLSMAHAVDFEAIERCGPGSATLLLCPSRPHRECSRSKAEPLTDAVVEAWDGRIVTYEPSYQADFDMRPPGALSCYHCSAEPVFHLLGWLGVREILSFGIDGGQGRAPQWANEPPGPSSYDKSISQLEAICERFGTIWTRG